MAKKKKKTKAKRKTKPKEKKDFSQNALSIVERLIGGRLSNEKKKKK